MACSIQDRIIFCLHEIPLLELNLGTLVREREVLFRLGFNLELFRDLVDLLLVAHEAVLHLDHVAKDKMVFFKASFAEALLNVSVPFVQDFALVDAPKYQIFLAYN